MLRAMHVAITGASAGIGEALAREYAAAGADVTLIARREPLLRALAASLPTRSHVVVQDLSDPARCAAWLPGAEAALGPVDVLINNAGVMRVEDTVEADPVASAQLVNLMLVTPLQLTRSVLPGMLQRKRGTVIDIASVAALVPTLRATWYSAIKAGHAAAAELLRVELRDSGVHVLTVYPGPVHSALGHAAFARYQPTLATRLLPWGNATELARRVRRAAEHRRARLVYPRFYALTRYFPLTSRWLTNATAPRLLPTGAAQPPMAEAKP